jgi:hypothetical protein
MVSGIIKRYSVLLIFSLVGYISYGQSVPKGIFYQAVARDNYGKELVNKDIDVKFSIISGTPLGDIVYQELHSHVITSKFGVFTRVIGTGTRVGGIYEDLSQIQWSQADHFLKVEVKFDNDFLDMGTMQFLTVPYALYAQKSLEPGPAGPKGDPGPKGDAGDPSTDSQTLSFNGDNLTISGGNTVNLSSLDKPHQLSLLGDTLSILGGNKVGLTNQIQDLTLDINNKLKITKNSSATEIDLSPFKQNLSYNSTTGILSISNGTPADISSLITAGIQDIHLTGNLLTIDKNSASTGVDLSKYNQALSYNGATRTLSISGTPGTIDLSELKNDADSDPTNELQTLSYNPNTGDLTISSKNTVNLLAPAGFKAIKSVSETGLAPGSTNIFICPEVEFNDGAGYNSGTGIFTVPNSGIYTFNITYKADGAGSGRSITMFKNVDVYEILWPDINSGSELTKFVTMKLDGGDIVYLKLYTGLSTYSGTGSFIGYKVN